MAEPVAKSNPISESGLELTREQIQAVINQKLENTIYWLNKAYDHRPEDSRTEKTLLDLMAKISRLKTEANTQFSAAPGVSVVRRGTERRLEDLG
ncbi:MAG TPA: hypothetical protein VIU33_07415 [Nitrospiria bacterium]